MKVKFNCTEYRAYILPADDSPAEIVGSIVKEGRAKKTYEAKVKKMYQADFVKPIEHLGIVADVPVDSLLENAIPAEAE